jgi:hypothetical protein
LSGVSTTTDIIRREKSNEISSFSDSFRLRTFHGLKIEDLTERRGLHASHLAAVH